jgi:hypothetical protein
MMADLRRGREGERRTLVNSCHEAEIARCPLERLVQVAILLAVGIDNGAVGQDDLKVGYGIACEAAVIAVERILKTNFSK